MSKLTIVREALAANKDVIVLDAREEVDLQTTHGFTHTVDIFVAHASGLYDVDRLQAFMMGLVPQEPTMKDEFRGGDSYMYFGKLYFDEPVGHEVSEGSRRIVITDPDIKLSNVFKVDEDGNHFVVINLDMNVARTRRTWVRLYPDEEYARRALNGKDVYSTNEFDPKKGKGRGLLHR